MAGTDMIADTDRAARSSSMFRQERPLSSRLEGEKSGHKVSIVLQSMAVWYGVWFALGERGVAGIFSWVGHEQVTLGVAYCVGGSSCRDVLTEHTSTVRSQLLLKASRWCPHLSLSPDHWDCKGTMGFVVRATHRVFLPALPECGPELLVDDHVLHVLQGRVLAHLLLEGQHVLIQRACIADDTQSMIKPCQSVGGVCGLQARRRVWSTVVEACLVEEV